VILTGVNVKDLAFKAAWTGVSAVLGYLATEIAAIGAAWAPLAAMAVNVALAWVRQKVGATPPDAPATGAFAK
jgi:hypothetical protein